MFSHVLLTSLFFSDSTVFTAGVGEGVKSDGVPVLCIQSVLFMFSFMTTFVIGFLSFAAEIVRLFIGNLLNL